MGIHKVVTRNGVRAVERQATPEEIQKSKSLDLSPEQEIEAALEAEDNDGPPVIPGEDQSSPGVAAGMQCPACDFSAGSMAAFQEHLATAHPVAGEGSGDAEIEGEGDEGGDDAEPEPEEEGVAGQDPDPVLRNQDGEEIGPDDEVPTQAHPDPVDEAPPAEEEEKGEEEEPDPLEALDFDLDSDL